jgi:hypothetical protein
MNWGNRWTGLTIRPKKLTRSCAVIWRSRFENFFLLLLS